MAKRWIKVWVNESLTGTIRFDFTPEERCVWYDLLVLAGNCRQEGVIAAGKNVPYPMQWIAGTLNVPLRLLKYTLDKCEKTGRVEVNGAGIRIVERSENVGAYGERLCQFPQRKKIKSAAVRKHRERILE